MEDKLIFTPYDDKTCTYPLCRLKLLEEMFGQFYVVWNEPLKYKGGRTWRIDAQKKLTLKSPKVPLAADVCKAACKYQSS